MNGGYAIIDFKGNNITTVDTEITGIFNEFLNAFKSKKPVLLVNVNTGNIDTSVFISCVSMAKNQTVFYFAIPIATNPNTITFYSIMVSESDIVTSTAITYAKPTT